MYSWYKDEELVSGESRPYLYVSEVDPGDRGDYTFMAVNDNGVAVSNTASIHIPGIRMVYACIIASITYSFSVNIDSFDAMHVKDKLCT